MRAVRAVMGLVSFVAVQAATASVSARIGGIASETFPDASTACNGCHTGGMAPAVSLSASKTCVLTGQTSTIQFTVTETNRLDGGVGGAGWNLRITGDAGVGTLGTGGPNAAGTQPLSGEITHNAPKTAVNVGATIPFSAIFTASSTPGTATLVAWGNSVNLSGTNDGDRAATATLTLTVAAAASCGGRVCGLVSDACGASTSCGACPSPQTCTSEGACECGTAPVATCGLGACTRFGSTCLPASCTPGAAATEICNGIDDDCDGSVDDDATCPSGYSCNAGVCLDGNGQAPAGSKDASTDGASSDAGSAPDATVPDATGSGPANSGGADASPEPSADEGSCATAPARNSGPALFVGLALGLALLSRRARRG